MHLKVKHNKKPVQVGRTRTRGVLHAHVLERVEVLMQSAVDLMVDVLL